VRRRPPSWKTAEILDLPDDVTRQQQRLCKTRHALGRPDARGGGPAIRNATAAAPGLLTFEPQEPAAALGPGAS
jgi:hypothetical protein